MDPALPDLRLGLAVLGLLALARAQAPRTDGAAEGDSPDRPNIILILTDDQGWSQTSARMDPGQEESASTYLQTPHMARLMREGMRFTSGYAASPVCTPSRRSILCGTAAPRSGSDFGSSWVPAEHVTIPRALAAASADYACGHFGKWGEQMISSPRQCGYLASDGKTGNVDGGIPISFDNPVADHYIDNEDPKRTRSTTERAVGFMRDQVEAGRPFYLQVSYYAPHLSVVCRDGTLARYTEKGPPDRAYSPAWAAMMEELDDGVGSLLEAVDDLGIEGQTYVFLTSDNGGIGEVPGGAAVEQGRPTNHPLTGAKHDLGEGGIRVPFVVRGPGVEAGSSCAVPVVGYDLLPTFHELAGGDGEVLGDDVDGVSLAPLLEDPSGDGFVRHQVALFFHHPESHRQTVHQPETAAVREGDLKLLLTFDRDGQIRSRSLHPVGLDPREGAARDLAGSRAEAADALQGRLLEFLEATSGASRRLRKPNVAREPRKRRDRP